MEEEESTKKTEKKKKTQKCKENHDGALSWKLRHQRALKGEQLLSATEGPNKIRNMFHMLKRQFQVHVFAILISSPEISL